MEKELKRTELNPDELENVSGGNWASDEENNKAKQYLRRLLGKYGMNVSTVEIYGRAQNIFMVMGGERYCTYTADDFIARVRNELHIED